MTETLWWCPQLSQRTTVITQWKEKKGLPRHLHFKQGVPIILDERPGKVLSYRIESNVSDNTDGILGSNLGRVKGIPQIPRDKYIPLTINVILGYCNTLMPIFGESVTAVSGRRQQGREKGDSRAEGGGAREGSPRLPPLSATATQARKPKVTCFLTMTDVSLYDKNQMLLPLWLLLLKAISGARIDHGSCPFTSLWKHRN